ncbi:MAG: LEA type 2 family protein [Verrucomicrobiia bacterium]
MRSAVSFALLILTASLLCSCSTLQEEAGVDVELVNVRLNEATVLETTAAFTVRVSNETSEPITLEGSVHKFYLNGTYIGKGMSAETLSVARLSSATQEVPVHLRNVALARRIRPILESRTMDYRVSSTLYLVNGTRSQRCRIVHDGEVALDDFKPNLGKNAQQR